MTNRTLEKILRPLAARLTVRIDWQGAAIDRLLDESHASIIDRVLTLLREAGWDVVPEATFAIWGERGSIDILAWHASTRTLLVVEVKSVIADIQGTLAPFDRKLRLAPEIARERGWVPAQIASLLIVRDTRTNRRRVATHAATFDTRLPDRAIAVRRFVRDPGPGRPLRGLWFLPDMPEKTPRHRVNRGGGER